MRYAASWAEMEKKVSLHELSSSYIQISVEKLESDIVGMNWLIILVSR